MENKRNELPIIVSSEQADFDKFVTFEIIESNVNGEFRYSTYINEFRIAGMKPIIPNRTVYQAKINICQIENAVGREFGSFKKDLK